MCRDDRDDGSQWDNKAKVSMTRKCDLPQAYHFSIFGCEYFADSVDKLIAFIRFAQEQIGQ